MNCSPSLSRRQLVALLGAFGVVPEAVEAQDAVKNDPRNYRVVLENDKVRVVDYTSKPGTGVCGVGRHWHPAHVTVQMTPAKVRITVADNKSQVIDVPAGAIFFEPAVTHTVENISGSGTHAYLIEIKDAAWKPASGTT